MRVAVIIPRLEQLGPIKVVQALVNRLSEVDNLKINVFHLDKEVDPEIKMFVPVIHYNQRSFCFGDYDIIHTNGVRPDLIAFINRKKIKYHISTIHNFVFKDLKFTYNSLISWIFGNVWLFIWRRADKLVCVSAVMKNYYEKWFSSSKLYVIHDGIVETDNSFMPDKVIIGARDEFHSKGLKVIGCAGILSKIKGIDQILYLVSEEKKIALVIIGKGKGLRSLQRLAIDLKISDRCIYVGFRSNAVNNFRYFDFFLIPSRSEGFGLSLIEAVQQKVPVICSDLPVFRELFTSDEVTFFKLDDKASLIQAMKLAIETGKGKTDLAYTRYTENYTDKIMAKRYLDLYQSACSFNL